MEHDSYRAFYDLDDYGEPRCLWTVRAESLHVAVLTLFEEYANGEDYEVAYEAFVAASSDPCAGLATEILSLLAMSTESHFNAAWIRAGRSLNKEGGQMKIPGTRANRLDSIAAVFREEGLVDFVDAEIDLLARLSTYHPRGRFPTPEDADSEASDLPEGSENFGSPQPWTWSTDDALLVEITEKMWRAMDEQDHDSVAMEAVHTPEEHP